MGNTDVYDRFPDRLRSYRRLGDTGDPAGRQVTSRVWFGSCAIFPDAGRSRNPRASAYGPGNRARVRTGFGSSPAPPTALRHRSAGSPPTGSPDRSARTGVEEYTGRRSAHRFRGRARKAVAASDGWMLPKGAAAIGTRPGCRCRIVPTDGPRCPVRWPPRRPLRRGVGRTVPQGRGDRRTAGRTRPRHGGTGPAAAHIPHPRAPAKCGGVDRDRGASRGGHDRAFPDRGRAEQRLDLRIEEERAGGIGKVRPIPGGSDRKPCIEQDVSRHPSVVLEASHPGHWGGAARHPTSGRLRFVIATETFGGRLDARGISALHASSTAGAAMRDARQVGPPQATMPVAQEADRTVMFDVRDTTALSRDQTTPAMPGDPS